MIKVQDWVASIPDEDKHIAYVGEDKSETRQFLLCGEGWENYEYFQFHLDMAFDPESITTRDSRQVVQTTRNYHESAEEAGKVVDEVTSKETYTVRDEEVANYSLTDIASLDKEVTAEGMVLTWTVLRQHTLLPGKLWATLRAVGDSGECIKKSAIMVFEVDAAINAVPAARPARSEFEEMEARIDAMCQDAQWSSTAANHFALEAEQHATTAEESAAQLEEGIRRVETLLEQTQAHCDDAVRTAQAAEEACAQVQTAVDATAAHAAQTAADATTCTNAKTNVAKAVERCSNYVMECDAAIRGVQKNVQAVENLTYHKVNVRDCGAVGDGVTDDRAAIIAAFDKAKTMLPCEVYFPAGVYGISNGITVELPYGSGGLRVCGAGRDITQIKYLESYNPRQVGNMWYAIRIWPIGMPDTKPPTDGDYLYDISITGLSVYDTDPCAHAIHPNKGDKSKEETHGFDLQYIRRVSVTDCNLLYVGDEAIDICGCYDVIVMNNHIEGSPAAGTAGGAISIGDGCKGVVVSGNTVNGSAPNEVLENGTVISKNNFGIAVESLFIPVTDVTIFGNVVTNIQGHGINLGATNEGSSLTNIIVSNNIIDGCRIGIDDEGTHPKQGIQICDNIISNTRTDGGDYGHAIRFNTGLVDVVVTGNTIKNIAGAFAIRSIEGKSTQIYANNLLDGLNDAVFYGSGNITIRDCVIKNTGLVTRGTSGAIICTTGNLEVSNCTMKAIANSKGIVGATSVENTDIELYKDGAVTSGDCLIDYGTSYRLNRVIGCRLSGRLWIKKDNGIVQGVSISSASIGNNAITVAANGVVVTGCNIHTTTNSAIMENEGCNHNLFAHNVVNRTITVKGAQSLAINNIDTRVTA